MLDEHDDLADRLDRLFTAGDPVTARRNFDAASARSRHGRMGAAALAAAAVLIVGLVGVSTWRDGEDRVQLAVTDASITPLSTPLTEPTPTSVDEARPVVARGADVEGRVYAASQFLPDGTPRSLEPIPAGLDRVRVAFYNGKLSGTSGGCQQLSGTYAAGDSRLELADVKETNYTLECPTADLGDLVVGVLAHGTATLSGNTLTFSSIVAGNLEFVEQPYQPAGVFCAPDGESLHRGEVTGDVAGSGPDPLQAAREQLAVNSETARLDGGLPFELVMANPDQALVSASKDGRPVLSVVLDNTPTGWAVTAFAACVPQPGPPLTQR